MYKSRQERKLEEEIMNLKVQIAFLKAKIDYDKFIIDGLKNKVHRISAYNHELIGRNLTLNKLVSN